MIRNLSPSQDYLSLIEKYQTAYTCYSTVQSKVKKSPPIRINRRICKTVVEIASSYDDGK